MDNKFLQQTADFIKLALEVNEDLQNTLLTYVKKSAVQELDKEKYKTALLKTADALYDSDFLTDDNEKKAFIRKSTEDPIYVVRVLEKVCEAADVAQIGKPARVAARPKEAEYDPVMEAAFGFNGSRGLIDD